jgi:Tol biopolymer transport system component
MKTIPFRRMCLFLVPALLFPAAVLEAYNNPPLKWKTIKTAHFEVHYHEGAEWTARKVAEVAEEVHGPITDLYQYEPPNPIHFVIKDTDDYANGAAYFYDNKVEIWATNLEFGFRGTSDWIRNVVTHEYIHIISIQAAFKMPRRIPSIYFQVIEFEKEKRSDVLNGYPSHLVSYPFSGISMPPWFAEGIAQYQLPGKSYDCWDTHRDMILRSAVLEDKMLTYDEMSFFGKRGLENEQVYDHGYGLVNYIASRYGAESIRDITSGLKSLHRLSADGALERVTGKTGRELHADWKGHLRKRYDRQLAAIRDTRREGALLAAGGYMTIAPTLSPDGRKIAFLSNKGSDHSETSLVVMDRKGRGWKVLDGGVTSAPQFSPDGRKILYSKREKINSYGSKVNDLFVYDIEAKKIKRLTRNLRAGDPDFSPDGQKIVCVLNRDGTHRLAILDASGESEREIYTGKNGVQLYNPHFSPDGETILFGIFESGTRDIASVTTDGTGFGYLLRSQNDERDARWTRGGDAIVFSSDRSGIFNIYEMAIDESRITQITNVIGGAFMPDEAAEGSSIVYCGYSAKGYSIFKLDDLAGPVQVLDSPNYNERAAGPLDECLSMRAGRGGDQDAVTAMAGGGVLNQEPFRAIEEPIASVPYKAAYSPFQFYPRFILYDGNPRFGLFMNSSEILNKQTFFLGGSFGTNTEYDAFLSYEIRNFYPTLFADFYVIRERSQDEVTDPEAAFRFFKFDLRYDLWQADLGFRLEFSDPFSLTYRNEFTAFYSHGEYSVHVDTDIFEDGKFFVSDNGGWKYYIGNQITGRYTYQKLSSAVDADINPRGGRRIQLQYMHAFDKLFTSGEFVYGFRPVFDDNNYNQYTADWREYVALPYLRHSLRLRLSGGVIDKAVDDFFHLYMGGRDGIRGYTYFSIGGRRSFLGSVMYRFPLLRNINRQFLHLHLRDVYGAVFYEAANAWTEEGFKTTGYKKSIGYEVRLNLGSYYIFPTAISVVSAYSLDPVQFVDPGVGDLPVTITQDRGWSYYVSVGFGFDL